jgi:hypothetical protein
MSGSRMSFKARFEGMASRHVLKVWYSNVGSQVLETSFGGKVWPQG